MKKVLTVITVVILLIIVFHPGRHAKYYTYVEVVNVMNELVPRKTTHNLKNCSLEFYKRLLTEYTDTGNTAILKFSDFAQPLNGGAYSPQDCEPIFKTAVIVPYRNRPDQLETFLNYMHPFLQSQKIHYQIFVVDQQDDRQFNRAKMLNIGAAVATNMNFSCLILHDVDLFPLNKRNIYACSKKPRHMSSAVDTLRFNLPYLEIVGGVFAIQSTQFQSVNGMSNLFYGWGGEDDDFYQRLKAHRLDLCRFAPEISEYSMLSHKKEKASNDRWSILKTTIDRQHKDGLNTLTQDYEIKLQPLYTHIIVT